MTTEEKIAQKFHDTYEFLAPEYGYITKEETREWDAESPNGKLMIATVKAVMCGLVFQLEEGEKAKAEIKRLTALLVATQEKKQEISLRFLDATPNEEYPIRILQAYRNQAIVKWATATDGSCDNPLFKIMNEHCDKRAAILDEAIKVLSAKE